MNQFKAAVPDYVLEIANTLKVNNYQAYLVGGSVRDLILGTIPNDFDIATNAYPEDLIKIFPKSIPTGAKFGTITVVASSATGENFQVQVTTYRSEADYIGGRWPTKVEYAMTIQEDLSRRDFTINAIALDLQNDGVLIDPFHGQQHLKEKLIKAVGNPWARFAEDGLRSVRACRLAAQLNFKIEADTLDAIPDHLNITAQVSIERFREELEKLLYKSPKPSIGFNLMKDTGILNLFIPELLEGVKVNQPEFHAYDVYTHTMAVVDAAVDSVKLAALFHDIAKPRCESIEKGKIHFYGHDTLGAEMAKEIMTRLRFPNATINNVVSLVRWHMFYYPNEMWRKQNKHLVHVPKASRQELEQHLQNTKDGNVIGGWSDGAIRRLIINVGGQDAMDQLMLLRVADAAGNPKSSFNPYELDMLSERIALIRQQDMALKITDLKLNGNDIMQQFNMSPGPKLGLILNYLLDLVVEDAALNNKQDLLKLAKDWLDNQQ